MEQKAVILVTQVLAGVVMMKVDGRREIAHDNESVSFP
jgi:hypothetical protein